MSMIRQLYPEQITFNSETIKGGGTTANGGPLSVRFEVTTDNAEDFTGNDIWATFMQATRRRLNIFLGIRDTSEFNLFEENDKSDLVLKFSNERVGENVTLTFTGMVFMNRRASNDQAILAEWEAEFAHESADGQTNPISIVVS